LTNSTKRFKTGLRGTVGRNKKTEAVRPRFSYSILFADLSGLRGSLTIRGSRLRKEGCYVERAYRPDRSSRKSYDQDLTLTQRRLLCWARVETCQVL